ncbi:hypothetical protein MEG1DRAFT_03577 [Photorhabdus temperata subsp. temperata Meg1]|uniref:Uncharacterized protein n=1 Tax=Photorhabdus temperata subsp. temperata Meg1 TaxID=1393735 RepID=A0A081RSY9_PHOTE|nr:hypothetical protein MEG1DRAFT_03577 [Photorhabdus temperata subsp. temperata Meg1]
MTMGLKSKLIALVVFNSAKRYCSFSTIRLTLLNVLLLG